MQPEQEIRTGGYLVPGRLDNLPSGVTATNLRGYVETFNTRMGRFEPDFYGTVTVHQDVLDEQFRTLDTLARALDLWPGQNPGDTLNGPQIKLLRAEVAFQVTYLRLLKDLRQTPPAKRLHFIWSGGAIRTAALDNIVAWADRVRDAGWTVTIWTDRVRNDWSSLTTKARLKYNDIDLAFIDQGVLDPRLWSAYDTVTHPAEGRPNYPASSDLARYSILKTLGGIYLDVDIAPGSVTVDDLGRAPWILYLAPEIRDTTAVRDHLGLDKETPITPTHIQRVANERLKRGLHNNNFISVAAGSDVTEAIIVQVVAELGKIAKYGGAASLVGDMADNAAFVTGPAAVKRALLTYVRTVWPKYDDHVATDLLNVALDHDLPLRWVTAESENQEH